MNIFIKEKALLSTEGHLPCIKQSVYAMIKTVDGKMVFGTNKMLNNITICPREVEGYATGTGYHLCKEVCNQNAHAEVDAIQNAHKKDMNIIGSVLTLVGHTYCCDNCIQVMKENGIASVHIIDDSNKIDTVIDLMV